MKRPGKMLMGFLFLFLYLAPAYSQVGTSPALTSPSAPPPAGSTDCLSGAIKDLKDRFAASPPDRAMAKNDVKDLSIYICYLTTASIRAKLLGNAEQSRLDKQPGATSNSSGSTSLVSKGSSPSLLGFALEHGGLTQTTAGNTITFRGNVANSIRALLDSSYLGSYKLGENDPLVTGLAKLSFGVSFDASSNQPSTTQGFSPSNSTFSGFSAKYELLDHRDPRDKRYRARWTALSGQKGIPLAQSFGQLNRTVVTTTKYSEWQTATFEAIDGLPDAPSDDSIRKVLQDAANLFRQVLWNAPEVQDAVGRVTTHMTDYLNTENELLDRIRTTPVVTVEYNYTRQLTTNNQNITSTQPNQQLPNLSNINLVLEKGMQGGSAPEFTLNAGVTLFNSTSMTTPKRGTVRDYQASAQLDVPLKEIANIGRPVLSFSGQFLALLEEPLGQKVMLNGVTIDRRGNMGIFQTKLSIPVKDSGIKIPISFTYASRTELIKEKDVRGNIGITFDLDTLFSKAK